MRTLIVTYSHCPLSSSKSGSLLNGQLELGLGMPSLLSPPRERQVLMVLVVLAVAALAVLVMLVGRGTSIQRDCNWQICVDTKFWLHLGSILNCCLCSLLYDGLRSARSCAVFASYFNVSTCVHCGLQYFQTCFVDWQFLVQNKQLVVISRQRSRELRFGQEKY